MILYLVKTYLFKLMTSFIEGTVNVPPTIYNIGISLSALGSVFYMYLSTLTVICTEREIIGIYQLNQIINSYSSL